ncbi:conserved protein of unknown function [Pararobbsia alpina]|uniref:hypothetical protein n=1 Tax=Pararobbsia alpina TaxID=621374 RepID=UPI0039A58C3F
MLNVYVEPVPKGRWGPVEGYVLEFLDGTKLSPTLFASERVAVNEIKLMGHVPMVAKVRVTDKRTSEHWERTE